MKKLTTEEFVEKSNLVHGGLYDYSMSEYIDSKCKVKIYCTKHDNIFYQSAGAHMLGKSGCLKCKGDRVSLAKYKDAQHFIKRAVEKHGDKFDYSESVYIDSRTKIKIKCRKHNVVFEQSANNHYFFNGCPLCLSEQRSNHPHKLSNAEFSNRARIIHGDFYDYSLVDIKNIDTCVKIVCPVHGVFEQIPYGHLTGGNCSDCAKGSFKVNSPAVLYVFGIKGYASEFTGFGITAHFSTRFETHKNNLGKYGYSIEDIFITDELPGGFIRQLENSILSEFPRDMTTQDLVGFKRENTTATHSEVVLFVQDYIRKHYGNT